jgi:hypothetical protein
MKYPALYEPSAIAVDARALWWNLRASLAATVRLVVLNLGMAIGHNREAAIDADIRGLMSLFQWYGRHYGQWWLARHGVRPESVDEAQLRHFIANADGMRLRVILAQLPLVGAT